MLERAEIEGACVTTTECETLYRAAFQAGTDGIALVDDQGRVVIANEAAMTLLDVAGQCLCEGDGQQVVLDPNVFHRDWASLLAAETFRAEGEVVHADGSRSWIEVAGRPNVLPGRHLLLLHDLTARRLAEREIERQARLLAEVHDAILATDDEGRITYWSRGAEALFGYAEAEVLGRLGAELVKAPATSGSRETVLAAALRLGSLSARLELHRRDGSPIVVEVNAARIEGDGLGSVFVAACRDVTDRERAEDARRANEARFHAFMDAIPALAWIRDERGRHVYVNRAREEATGLDRERAREVGSYDLSAPGAAGRLQADDEELLESDEPLDVVQETDGPGATPRTWHVVKFPFSAGGGARLMGGIALDITRQRGAEDELRRRNEELERFNLVMIDRELRMIELKREVNRLHARLGLPLPYTTELKAS